MSKNIKKLLLLGCLLAIVIVFVSVKFSFAETPEEGVKDPTSNTNSTLNVDIPGLEGGEVTLPKYIKAVYQFGIGLLAVLAMGMIMIGGYQYMFSAGENITKTSDAKARIRNALIGLFIALTSFLLLNTINPEILEGVDQAEMIKLQEQKADNKSTVGQYCNNSLGFVCEEGLTCSSLFTDGTCEGAGAAPPAASTGCPSSSVSVNPGTYSLCFQSQSIANQYNSDASTDLKYFLKHMAENLPQGIGNISSISDDNIAGGTCNIWSSPSVCNKPECQHDCNSCHYGGTSCKGKSYAVDYGDQQNSAIIENTAKQYPTSAVFVKNEGNHIHISVKNSNGTCGCDGF